MSNGRALAAIVVGSVAFLVACGGSHSASSGSGGGGGGAPGSPASISVTAGATTAANISVVSPQSSPSPNAQFLGVNLAQGGATVTGDTVSRSQGTATVTMYGAGLSASMTVSITGPGDIEVGALTGVTAQDGTPGVQFPITLNGNTALGARTVVMQNSKNDATTFAGGLEVVP